MRQRLVLILLACVVSAAAAGPRKRFAVTEFDSTALADVAERKQVADAVRAGARRALPVSDWDVVTRETTEVILRESECTDTGCVLDALRFVQADQGIQVDVHVVNGVLRTTLQLHDVTSGSLVASDSFTSADLGELLQRAAEHAERLVSTHLVGNTAPLGPGEGWLSVHAEPPGAVFIDGVARGTTPLVRVPMGAGSYLVTVSAPGHTTLQETVVVEPGRATTIQRRLVTATGRLRLDVTPPSASITLDGALSGPGSHERVPTGKHRVVASLEGYREATRDIEVLADALTSVRMDLVPLPGRVVLRANGEGTCTAGSQSARVATDAPGVITTAPGRVKLTCRRRGSADVALDVDVLPGRAIPLDIRFHAAEQPRASKQPSSPRAMVLPGMLVGAGVAALVPALILAGCTMLVAGAGAVDRGVVASGGKHVASPLGILLLASSAVVAAGGAGVVLLMAAGLVAAGGVTWLVF